MSAPEGRAAGLVAADFSPIAVRGGGDRLNAYAHSAAWFRHALYIGTTRANLSLLKVRAASTLEPWPTRVPADIYDQDLRAQVLAYEPEAGTWRRAFRSPVVPGVGGEVSRDLGYRGMAVFKAADEVAPSLYLASWASARSGRPPALLRTRDGIRFDTVGTLGDDATVTSYRTLAALGDRLYAAPTGRLGGAANAAGIALLAASRRPAAAGWKLALDASVCDAGDLGVLEVAELGGRLYVGTINPGGFSLWSCRPDGPPPYAWAKVVSDGAGRGPLNEAAISLCAFRGALYVGTAIQNGGYDRTYGIGPAAGELLRVHPDGTWDLLVGEERDTSAGAKRPLSGRGPGFDNPFNAYIWRLAVHGGWLYATTYNWAVFLPYLPLREFPAARALLGRHDPWALAAAFGGFELWRTSDGVDWAPVVRDGFGTPYNYGGRSLLSTPHGLVVGTANPFGPEVAVPVRNGWRYAPNERGGLEIWLGRE